MNHHCLFCHCVWNWFSLSTFYIFLFFAGGCRSMTDDCPGLILFKTAGRLLQHRWSTANAMMCVSLWVSAEVTRWCVSCVSQRASVSSNMRRSWLVSAVVFCSAGSTSICKTTCRSWNYRSVGMFLPRPWPWSQASFQTSHSCSISLPSKAPCTAVGNIFLLVCLYFSPLLLHPSCFLSYKFILIKHVRVLNRSHV